MFDTPIVEIAIGLVFIFILLSIICSGLTEIVAAKLRSLRSKNLQEALKNILDDDDLVDKFNDHPLIKGLTKQDKKPSYVPSDIFARVLLDIVQSETKEKQIDDAIVAFPNDHVKSALITLKQNTENSLTKFQENISGWFDESMDRASGWYQRKAQNWTFIIAILVVIVINVDSFSIANKLWTDNELRTQFVSAAEKFNKQNAEQSTPQNNRDDEEIIEEERENISEAYSILAKSGLPIGWDFNHPYYSIDAGNIKSLDEKLKSEKCYENLQTQLKLKKSENILTPDEFISIIDSAGESNNCDTNSYKSFLSTHDVILKSNFKQGLNESLKQNSHIFIKGLSTHWLGWLFTALAVSLGAPFWFDLLNKLINARTAGKKPKSAAVDKKES